MTGANTVWTYSNLAATGNSLTTAYVDPSSVPNATNYAGCTLVAKQGSLNTFYKAATSPSTQTEFLGINSSSITMNFTNSAISMRYPFNYGDVVTDNFSGSFTFSLSGSASGNATVSADGTGTLVLPNGIVLNNVLRVKSVQNTNFNAFIITGNMKQTMYSWYHASQKFPVLSINYQSISISGSGSPTITAQVMGNTNDFTIGMKENYLPSDNFIKLFPNPAADHLNVLVSQGKTLKIQVLDINGKKMIEQDNDLEVVNIKHLESGMYFILVHTDHGILSEKIIKQ
jgi:hypothetical protein